ncbi:MAG: Ig-like domain-containing protein, partial [Planctomycetia bacterium]
IKFVSSTALVAVRVGNTGPSATNWSASTSEDTTLSFTAAQFTAGFSDPELDSLASITITALPSASAGVLKFKGINVTLNQVVLAGELNQLAFVPVADFNGSANFSYTASDGYLSSSAAMVAITVNAVNDRPVLDTAGSPVLATIAEDISSGSNLGTTVSDIVVNGSITDVDVISPSTVPEAIAVTLVDNTNGVWQYKVASGNWTSFSATRDVVSLGASALLLDGTDSIRFLPDANFNGTATFLFRAWDKSSGVAGGTSDPFALGGNTALSVAEETATITVSAVNDAPTTSSKTISFNEDTTYVLTAADFAFADVDAGNTLQSVAITSLPTAGSLTLNNGSADVPVVQSQSISVADIIAGKLKFTPVANAFGSSYATMGFTVSDGSASSSPAILTFDVTDTNDAPTSISWATGGSITENTTSAQGVVVGTLAATDPNTGDVLSFRRTSNPNFSISPDGTVRYVGVVGLDYEITPTQTLGVTVTDSQGLTYSANVTVTVTNASETAPTIKASNFFAALNSLTTITSSNLCAVDEQESGASLVFTIIEQITGGTLWVDT